MSRPLQKRVMLTRFVSFYSSILLSFAIASASEMAETTDYDTRTPLYQQLRPLWGFSLSTSLKALGDTPTIPNLGDGKVRAYSMQLEFQPSFVQSLGVIGFGPSLNLYSVSPIGQVTRAALGGIWSVGGQIRYQARFFREQPIVPYAGYTAEYLNYRFVNESKGKLTAKGPIFGALFLLNFLDSETAAEFYVNSGVLRSYLVAEFKTLEGSDSQVQFSGKSFYFGLRFEF